MEFIAKLIYSLGIILMVLSGTIYGISGASSFEPVLLALSIVFICISNGKLYLRNYYKNGVSRIFVFFIISIAVSFISHPEMSMIITIAGLSLLSFALLVQVPALKINGKISYKSDLNTIMVTLLLIQIYSIMQGFSTYRFAGIFSNSNFTGGEAATLCAVSCAVFLQRFLVDKKQGIILPLLSMFISVVIVVATNSRTSVGVVVIMLLLMGFFVLRQSTDRSLTIKITGLVFLAIIAIIALYRMPFVNSAINEILVKFSLRQGNELAGRQDRWAVVFERLKFFGNGESTAFGTHNTFLSMLDQYGYFPCVLLLLFVMVGSIKAFAFALKKNECDMKYLPIFCFACFGITCMFEQMLLKNIMLLCLYSVPLLSQTKTNITNSESFDGE